MDRSWESSVVQLAQAGNLRAIAFWVNRYLVPQGICAQVSFEEPGHLSIRIVSHTQPDCTRLVQFIYDRLNSLKAPTLRSARIRAQLVGNSELLWEKRVQLAPAPSANLLVNRSVNQAVNPSMAQAAVSQTPACTGSPHTAPHPHSSTPKPPVAPISPPSATTYSSSPLVQSVRDFQFPVQTPTAQPPTQPSAPSRPIVSQPKPTQIKQIKKQIKRRKSSLSLNRSLKHWSRATVRQITAMPSAAHRLSMRSTRWFNQQTVPIRALTLGGSAVAVFFLGCGVELLRHYVTNPSFGQSTSPPGTFRANRPFSAKITTALDHVPVIHPTVRNPDDPSVTLVFSNSAALGRASGGSRNQAQLSNRRPVQGIPAYQKADLVMTSLDHPLTLPQIHAASGESSSSINRDTTQRIQSHLPMPEQSAPLNDQASSPDSLAEGEFSSRRLPQLTVQELLANGVNVVNLADNLPVKSNTAEQVQTLEVLKQSNIQSVGAGSTPQETRRPQVFEVKGHRIAYLAYSEQSLATQLAVAVNLIPPLPTQIAEDIQAIREQVDWVIVSFRWQRNLRAYPETWQMNLTRMAVDHGADLIVGYHPQMTQGAEIYNGRVIAYSLGSSIEEYVAHYRDEPVADRNTVTLKVTLQDEEMGIELLPIQLRQGQAAVAEGETGNTILEYFHQASSLFDNPLRSPITLDSRVRLSLPAAPDAELPTDPFLSYPDGQ